MTGRNEPRYRSPWDPYEQVRCLNCGHLRYADEQPGDPCRFCGPQCARHETPAERARREET